MTAAFADDLACTLLVWSAGVSTAVPGAHVKRIELALAPHGFSGTVVFWVRADDAGDALHGVLAGDAAIELELGVARAQYPGEPPPPLTVRGAVTARRFLEQTTAAVDGMPVQFRRYTCALVDPARAAWSVHRPTVVSVDHSWADVIRGQLVDGVSLDVAWPELRQRRGLVALGLGADDASFHDFVCWLAAACGGQFWLDYAARRYHLDADKPPVDQPAALDGDVIAELEVVPAEPARHQPRFLNSWIAMDAVTAVDVATARPPLCHDTLVHTPIAREVSTLVERATRRIAPGKPELAIAFRGMPAAWLAPGAPVTLGAELSAKLTGFGDAMRVVELSLAACAKDAAAEADVDCATTTYDVTLAARLEHADDPRARLPAIRTPRYPFEVEGQIVSAVGATGDRAYTVYEDSATSQDRYRVLLPTWNVTIDVPFTPLFQPGHLYFPAYRDARVRVALEFDRARLVSFLDWGPSVRLPLASQGNHILFGKNATSETSLRHWYVDSKPELQLRRANAGNIGRVAVSEGSIVIETFDEDGAGLAPPTVSVQPEAAAAQASLAASAGVAQSDLESAVTSASGQLDGELGAATAAVEAAATQVQRDVRQATGDAEASLRGLADTAAAAQAQASNTVADARAKLAALFEDGES